MVTPGGSPRVSGGPGSSRSSLASEARSDRDSECSESGAQVRSRGPERHPTKGGDGGLSPDQG